jgi:hypothetical protein
MAEPAPCKEPADALWDKAKSIDFIYEMAKVRGIEVGF